MEGSDVDVRGCALNSRSDLLGMTNFEQVVDNGTDTTVYAFNKLVSLLLNCNPNCIELLGCNPTVYGHIVHAVDEYKGSDITVKLAILLHDIGKPLCYTENKTGGHFYDHACVSRDLAKTVLDRFKADNETRHNVTELVLFHDAEIKPSKKVIRKWLNKIGEEQLHRFLEVRRADVKAHSEKNRQKHLDECDAIDLDLEEVLAEEPCFSVKDLAINGKDLLGLGVPEGPEIGRILNSLLDDVMSERVQNTREALLERARACCLA